MQQHPAFVQPKPPVLPITLIDRYITREIFKVFVSILVILLLVLVGGSFVKLLELAAEGDIANEVVFTLLGLEILRLAGRLIPPAFFFAILFVLGRMYRDNEMTVLATTGIGPGRLYRLVSWLAIPVALVTLWLSVFLYPSISYLANRIKLEQQDAVLVAAMDAGRFVESGRGDTVLYAKARGNTRNSLEHLFVQHRDEGKLAIMTAAAGHHRLDPDTGLRVVTLEDGVRYEGKMDERALTVLEFGAYDMWVNPVSTDALERKYSTWSTWALWNSDALKARAELQKRFSHPLSLLAFTLLAVPLSRSMPRQGVHGRVVTAVFVYLVAVGLGEVASTWMEKGVTAPWLGTWWVPATMFAVGLVLAAHDALPRLSRLARGRT